MKATGQAFNFDSSVKHTNGQMKLPFTAIKSTKIDNFSVFSQDKQTEAYKQTKL